MDSTLAESRPRKRRKTKQPRPKVTLACLPDDVLGIITSFLPRATHMKLVNFIPALRAGVEMQRNSVLKRIDLLPSHPLGSDLPPVSASISKTLELQVHICASDLHVLRIHSGISSAIRRGVLRISREKCPHLRSLEFCDGGEVGEALFHSLISSLHVLEELGIERPSRSIVFSFRSLPVTCKSVRLMGVAPEMLRPIVQWLRLGTEELENHISLDLEITNGFPDENRTRKHVRDRSRDERNGQHVSHFAWALVENGTRYLHALRALHVNMRKCTIREGVSISNFTPFVHVGKASQNPEVLQYFPPHMSFTLSTPKSRVDFPVVTLDQSEETRRVPEVSNRHGLATMLDEYMNYPGNFDLESKSENIQHLNICSGLLVRWRLASNNEKEAFRRVLYEWLPKLQEISVWFSKGFSKGQFITPHADTCLFFLRALVSKHSKTVKTVRLPRGIIEVIQNTDVRYVFHFALTQPLQTIVLRECDAHAKYQPGDVRPIFKEQQRFQLLGIASFLDLVYHHSNDTLRTIFVESPPIIFVVTDKTAKDAGRRALNALERFEIHRHSVDVSTVRSMVECWLGLDESGLTEISRRTVQD